jgi:aspartyl protease family protein
MWKQVAPLFVIAVLLGWMMPAGNPDATPGAPAAVAQPVTPAATAPSAAWREGDTAGVVLERAGDGHFYAQGSANGADLRFLVDTGASVVALSEGDAAKLGLYWNPGELSNIGRGVNGEVMGKAVMLDTLQVGSLVAHDVQAVIIPDGLDVSLLGQSFLSRIGTVSIADNRMTLKE